MNTNNYKFNFIGYYRASPTDHHSTKQIITLENAGVSPENIYRETTTSKTIKKRPQIQELLKNINRTNVVIFPSLNDLGSRYKDIKEIIRTIQNKGTKLMILDLGMSRKYGVDKIFGNILNNFMLELLNYQSTKRRKIIKEKQAQGIERAKREGKYRGRKPIYNRGSEGYHRLVQAFHDYEAKPFNDMTTIQICHKHGINIHTFYAKLRIYKITHFIPQKPDFSKIFHDI